MYIRELTLRHFRNYTSCTLQFDDGLHLFIGDNAQGKTNLLEAMYVLALAKSHRTSKDKQLIQWNEEQTVITGRIVNKYTTFPLELHITNQGKRAKLNHLDQKRLSQYIGSLNVVMFAPEDLNIVKGAPAIRRKFIDMELGQVSPTYLYHLSRYQQLLMQRNALLKDWEQAQKNRHVIDVFTVQLIEEAVQLWQRRIKFTQQLQKWSAPIHEEISKGKEKLNIHYQFSIPLDKNMNEDEMTAVITKYFEENYEKDLRRGTTLVGPHKDDLSFTVNDKEVQVYGSQGQQRTTALSVKLAEIELIHLEKGEYPILLLDDVLSELDDHRRTHLLQAIQNKVQTFVTNTSTEGIDQETLQAFQMYQVKEGTVLPI